MLIWLAAFVLDVLFWLWIIFWGGAQWLEGTFKSGFILHVFAPNWSAEGIKWFAGLSLIFSVIWFIAGIFNPDLRFV